MKRTIHAKPKKTTPAAPSMRARDVEIKLLKRRIQHAYWTLAQIANDSSMKAKDMRVLAQDTIDTEPTK